MKKQLLVLMICAGLALPVFTAPVLAAKGEAAETVGGFAVKLSAALGTPVSSPKAAVETLKAAGVNLQADLSSTLTHDEAARILSDLGMKVATPADPTAEISIGKSSQLAAAAGLNVEAATGLASTELPVYCLDERNHGQCTGCCKDALASHPELTDGKVSRFCSRFCKTTQPPTSDPEPQP